MKHLPLAAVALLSLAALALLLRSIAEPRTEAPPPRITRTKELPPPAAGSPPAPPVAARRLLAPVVEAAAERVDLDELHARLAALGAVDLRLQPELDAEFEALLDPALVRAALAALVSGELKTHPDVLSPGELGAIRLLMFAGALYNTAEGVRRLAEEGHAVDGAALVEEVLRALALIEEPAASVLARVYAGLRADDGPVVGVDLAPLLRDLIALYPDREDVYTILLERLGEEAPIEFDLQFLTGEEDPRLVKSHLIAAFEKADRAQALQLLKLTEELYEEGGEALRAELAMAVAVGAPVELAAGFLAERATPRMLGQFDALGLRPGGQDALARSYNDLAAVGSDPATRRMLVSGLAAGGRETLLGIAEMDPDPAVRGQAALTATFAPDFRPSSEYLGTLRQLSSLGDQGLPAYATISAASNLLSQAKHAGDQALTTETIGFLRQLALDPDVPAFDRAKVPAILEPHLPPEEHQLLSQLVAELE